MSEPGSDTGDTGPGVESKAKRPASWTVFGIIHIILGAFGVLGGLGSIAMLGVELPGSSDNPALKLMTDSQAYRLFFWISTPLGVVASIVLVVAGAGLLQMRGWGRRLSLAYAWYAIVAALVSLAVTWVVLVQPLLGQLEGKSDIERFALIGGAIGAAVGSFLGLLYPVLILVFLRKDARQTLAGSEPGQPENPYEAPQR